MTTLALLTQVETNYIIYNYSDISYIGVFDLWNVQKICKIQLCIRVVVIEVLTLRARDSLLREFIDLPCFKSNYGSFYLA